LFEDNEGRQTNRLKGILQGILLDSMDWDKFIAELCTMSL
jgi:hypothetical protein